MGHRLDTEDVIELHMHPTSKIEERLGEMRKMEPGVFYWEAI